MKCSHRWTDQLITLASHCIWLHVIKLLLLWKHWLWIYEFLMSSMLTNNFDLNCCIISLTRDFYVHVCHWMTWTFCRWLQQLVTGWFIVDWHQNQHLTSVLMDFLNMNLCSWLNFTSNWLIISSLTADNFDICNQLLY